MTLQHNNVYQVNLQVTFTDAELKKFCDRVVQTTYFDWCKEYRYDEEAFRLAVYRYKTRMKSRKSSRITSVVRPQREARQSVKQMQAKGINFAQIMMRQKCRCPACHVDLIANGYHADHILPLSLGGPNEAWNIQFLCQRCNSHKSNMHPDDWSRTMGVDLPSSFVQGHEKWKGL